LKPQKPIYVIEFEPVSGNWLAPPEARLKGLLKRALRTFGFRCVNITMQKPVNVATVKTPAPARTTLDVVATEGCKVSTEKLQPPAGPPAKFADCWPACGGITKRHDETK